MHNPDLPHDQYRLCYVDEPFAYFTSADIDKQWGDDWNDAPYEHNAGEPYEWIDGGTNDNHRGKIIKLVFDADLITPRENHLNSPYSVEQINAGQIAWLRSHSWADKAIAISAGTTVSDFFRLIKEADGIVFVPAESLAAPSTDSEVTG